MPRIHGIRERRYANYYDAARVLEDFNDNHYRLFGNRNIGVSSLTNMQIAQQLPYDSTLVIANVYVRTNMGNFRPRFSDEERREIRDLFIKDNDGDAIGTLLSRTAWERTPLQKALDEWAHSTVLDLVIGDKPMLTMNVYDLMDGPAFGPDELKHDQKLEDDQPPPWRKHIGRPILVPVRQNFSVQLRMVEGPTRELRRHATNAGIQPDPLVWVHLEGLATRDVY